MSVYTDEDVVYKNIQYNRQLTKRPILPLIDRPKPVIEAIKAYAPVVPRTKLLGVFGVIDPPETVKNVPQPWGPRTWPVGADVGGLPSVVQAGAGVTGPSRTMHPELSVVVT